MADDRIPLVGGPCDGRTVPVFSAQPMVTRRAVFATIVRDVDGAGWEYRYDYDEKVFVYAGPAEPPVHCWARLPLGHGWCYEPPGHLSPHQDCDGHEFTDDQLGRS